MRNISNLFVVISLFVIQNLFCHTPFLDAFAKRGKKIIMINPSGHSGDPGRKLKNSCERAETIKFAQHLQEQLENKNDDLRVIITRTPGEVIVDFQDASFANRLDVDLFLNLSFYAGEQSKPEIFIYYYVADPIADFAKRSLTELSFIPVLQAHQFNIRKTKQFAEHIKLALSNHPNSGSFELGELLGIPVRPLLGIAAPSILLEIGWPQGDCSAWKDFAEFIVASIDSII